MTAWFVIIVVCAAGTHCAEFVAPMAPFEAREDCEKEAAEYVRSRPWLGFFLVEPRCEEWPLERG